MRNFIACLSWALFIYIVINTEHYRLLSLRCPY